MTSRQPATGPADQVCARQRGASRHGGQVTEPPRRRRRQSLMTRKPVGGNLLLAAALLSACSTDEGPTSESATASDCTTQIRVGSAVYSSYGTTQRPASRHVEAERAVCEDVGRDARGSVFPAQPEHVAAWRFPGYPPSKVLAVRYDTDSFHVFTADSLPDAERDRILEDLRQRPG